MNDKEVQEMATDVVAIVKREREAQAPKYGSFMEVLSVQSEMMHVAGKNKGKEAEDEKTYLHQ